MGFPSMVSPRPEPSGQEGDSGTISIGETAIPFVRSRLGNTRDIQEPKTEFPDGPQKYFQYSFCTHHLQAIYGSIDQQSSITDHRQYVDMAADHGGITLAKKYGPV